MNRRKSILYTAIFVLFLSTIAQTLFSLKGCYSTTLSRTFFAADTVCTITLYDSDEDTLDKAVELSNSLADRFNCRDDSSEIGRLNKTGICKNPSPELYEIINQGIHFSSLKNGLFDITVKPLSSSWDFKENVMPSKDEISAATKKVNYKNIKVYENSISLKNNAEIDLGAIAKGYIADKVSDFLVKNGVKSAIINLGGNITTIGKRDGNNFTIGIQTPFNQGNIASISCGDTSVVTSGIYQRYFKKDGKIYHHLLSTKTGYPVQNSLHSVTIISPSATRADALSTLCFLLGKDEGMKLVEATDNTEAVFIDGSNKLHLSSGLKQSGNIIEIK